MSRQDALVNSIRAPSANIARRYKPVTLVTTNNQLIQGTIKSEDAFSIQIMDSNQSLRGFKKITLQARVASGPPRAPITGNRREKSPERANNILKVGQIQMAGMAHNRVSTQGH